MVKVVCWQAWKSKCFTYLETEEVFTFARIVREPNYVVKSFVPHYKDHQILWKCRLSLKKLPHYKDHQEFPQKSRNQGSQYMAIDFQQINKGASCMLPPENCNICH